MFIIGGYKNLILAIRGPVFWNGEHVAFLTTVHFHSRVDGGKWFPVLMNENLDVPRIVVPFPTDPIVKAMVPGLETGWTV